MPRVGPSAAVSATPTPKPIAKPGALKREEADLSMGKTSQAHALTKVLRLAAGKLDLEAALELHQQAAAEPGLDAVDPREVDDLLAVGAKEMPGVKPLLHRGERAEKLRLVLVEMQAGGVCPRPQPPAGFFPPRTAPPAPPSQRPRVPR